MAHSFELRSIPDDRKRGRLFLLQLPLSTRHMASVSEPMTVARLDGTALESAAPALGEAFRSAGLAIDAITELLRSDQTVPLSEDVAIRLGLIFNAVNGLRSESRIEIVVQKIAAWKPEDVVYWLNKIVNDSAAADAHRRALIMILTET